MISTPLQDRLDDLADAKAGNVRAQVSEALDAAWEHLLDHAAGRGFESVAKAAEAVQSAVDSLSLLRRRLTRLDEEEGGPVARTVRENT